MLQITDDIRNNIQYEGTTRKFGVTIDGINYMVKFAKDDDMSVICEYIASSFIGRLGYQCQNVQLGIYKGELADVVYDFASNSEMNLHSFKDTKQSSENTDIGDKEYTYDDVLYLIDKHVKLTEEMRNKTKKQFWQMFICDAILANRDRHWGNWGYLGKDGEDSYIPAPIYDNGASLFPGIAKAIEAIDDNRKQFLKDRVFVFPASLFKVQGTDRTYRSNYNDMFSDLRISRTFSAEVKNIRNRYSYEDVFRIISDVVNSIDVSVKTSIKKFWIEIVTLRYMCIVCRETYDNAYLTVERMMNNL